MMNIDEQVSLGHLLLQDRKCKKCGEIKNLIDGFYRTRRIEGRFHRLIHMNVNYVQ